MIISILIDHNRLLNMDRMFLLFTSLVRSLAALAQIGLLAYTDKYTELEHERGEHSRKTQK